MISGKYTKEELTSDRMKTLVDMIRFGDYPNAKTIRNMLKAILPEGYKVDAMLIANVRLRANKLAARMNSAEFKITPEDAAAIVSDSQDDALNGKIGGFDPCHPEYVTLATKELKSMLVDALDKGKELDVIVSFFQQLKEKDPTFDYRIGRDSHGKVKVIVWQNGIMRGHCQSGLL